MASPFQKALAKIDEAHALDPNKKTVNGEEIPYELHYANKMTSYLQLRSPAASEPLQLAVHAQHFRRWEVPRDSYPMTRVGYHAWRTYLKKRQAQLVGPIVDEAGFKVEDSNRVMALIEKEGLRQGEEEVQVLEDVACLVFLDDQFEEFEEKHDEEKIIRVLRKTWAKMSPMGQEMALKIPMVEKCRELVEKALNDDAERLFYSSIARQNCSSSTAFENDVHYVTGRDWLWYTEILTTLRRASAFVSAANHTAHDPHPKDCFPELQLWQSRLQVQRVENFMRIKRH
ncbi:hypothetical protein LTR50_006185 [Elasticomyces elasticus]|nr:hypothetical protein LTR50_006185 [Elasticomyces elasticus]